MSKYLSEIAARNIQNKSNFLKPVTDISYKDSQTQNESNFEYSHRENLSGNENFIDKKNKSRPDNLQPQDKTDIPEMYQKKITADNIELPYLTKHIDRLKIIEKNIIVSTDMNIKKENTANDYPVRNVNEIFDNDFNLGDNKTEINSLNKSRSKKFNAETKEKRSGVRKDLLTKNEDEYGNESAGEEKSVRLTIPETDKNNNENSVHIKSTVIKPALKYFHQHEKNNPAKKKDDQDTARLVIGKITVEVIPPVSQAQPNVVTRVIQAPSNEKSSRKNKLSFGLGQL